MREIETYWYLDECRKAEGLISKDTYDPSDPKIKRALTGDYGTCPPEQWRVRLHQAEKCVKKWGTMLEIGFGGGEILKFAREEGRWKRIIGIEVHPDYVLFARSLGFEAYYRDVGTQSALPDLESKCDLVLASEVMEHIDNPTKFLFGAKKYLSRKGVLWASFAVDKLVQEIDPDEWHWWTPEAVNALADRCGLKIVQLDPTPFALVASMKER